jgi:hypothetical protein
MIRKGQLSDENRPAYKQFIALAGYQRPQISAALYFMNICDRTVSIGGRYRALLSIYERILTVGLIEYYQMIAIIGLGF